jgi:hypothetical protein
MSKEWDLGEWDEDDSAQAANALTQAEKQVQVDRHVQQDRLIAERIAQAVEAARPSLGKIPAPVEPEGTGALTAGEQSRLDDCRAGVELLSTAYWIAGKSLDTIACGRLFRDLPHRLDPERRYGTIEEWASVEYGISQSRCSKLRAAWRLGEILNARGYRAPEGQVREILPVQNRHGLKAAIGLYELVVQAAGSDKVTAERLRETVALLPGNLALSDDDDPIVIAQSLAGAIEQAPPPAPKATTALPTTLKRTVEHRAVDLANRLDRGRIPRQEVLTHLLEAFADERDSRVFDVVLERMKNTR